MRGCSCAGSSCGCAIQAGNASIVIDGTGTATDPFEISLGVFSIDEHIEFTEGDWIDIARTGSGTALDPTAVEIDVHTGTSTSVVPTTGQTVTPGADVREYLVNPAGTLAALTITLPASPTMFEEEIIIVSTQTLTALTVGAAGGNTVAGAPTTLAANGFFRMRLFGTVWRRVG